jgi:hypothetical protein
MIIDKQLEYNSPAHSFVCVHYGERCRMQSEKVKNAIVMITTGAEFESDVGTSCITWSGSGHPWQPREKAGVKDPLLPMSQE